MFGSRDLIHWSSASFWCIICVPVFVIILVLKKKVLLFDSSSYIRLLPSNDRGIHLKVLGNGLKFYRNEVLERLFHRSIGHFFMHLFSLFFHYIYVYIYIYRERGRKKGTQRERHSEWEITEITHNMRTTVE